MWEVWVRGVKVDEYPTRQDAESVAVDLSIPNVKIKSPEGLWVIHDTTPEGFYKPIAW